MSEAKTAILNNKTALGIEFGSTRIKAVLVDNKYNPIASGSYEWENRYENGVWTYSLDDIRNGLQGSYSDLVKDVQEKYGVELTSVGALGRAIYAKESNGCSINSCYGSFRKCYAADGCSSRRRV